MKQKAMRTGLGVRRGGREGPLAAAKLGERLARPGAKKQPSDRVGVRRGLRQAGGASAAAAGAEARAVARAYAARQAAKALEPLTDLLRGA